MSVDTDDGRRPTRGYSLQRVYDVNMWTSFQLARYAVSATVDVKRTLFGKRLFVDFEQKPDEECPN